MQCPKCDSVMETVNYQRVEINRCTTCLGIWFDPGEADQLKKMGMSEFLDKGDPAVGKTYNELENVSCPLCGDTLDKVCDEKQTHIQYESCPKGHGAFFDAGEFKDWKYETLMDRLRGLFVRLR